MAEAGHGATSALRMVAGAWELAQAHPRVMLAAWAAGAVWVLVTRAYGHAAGLSDFGAPLAGYAGQALLAALGPALISAVVLRVLLGAPSLRLDTRLLAYVVVAILAAAAPFVLHFAARHAIANAEAAGVMTDLVDVMSAARPLITLGEVVLEVAFLLWPLGLLVGGPTARPLAAARAMRGARLAFAVACVLAVGPTFVLGTLAAMRQFGPDGAWALPAAAALASLQRLILAALAAEVFRRQVLARDEVAIVFE